MNNFILNLCFNLKIKNFLVKLYILFFILVIRVLMLMFLYLIILFIVLVYLMIFGFFFFNIIMRKCENVKFVVLFCIFMNCFRKNEIVV